MEPTPTTRYCNVGTVCMVFAACTMYFWIFLDPSLSYSFDEYTQLSQANDWERFQTNGQHSDDAEVNATRLCTQAERVQHVTRYCHGLSQRSHSAASEDSTSPIIVDKENNLTICLIPKAGCTSTKAFVLSSRGYQVNETSKEDSLMGVHKKGRLRKLGIVPLMPVDRIDRREFMDSRFNLITVRHPLDRLISVYRDKIVDEDPTSNHPEKQAAILRSERSELFERNATLCEMEFPQTDLGVPSFREFLSWASKTEVDRHWEPMSEACHVCMHPWGSILRIETMATDWRILSDKLENNMSSMPLRHSHERARDYSIFDRNLALYEDIPNDILDYWLEFYRTDMELFGYHWDRHTLMATCAIDTNNGICC